MGLGPASTGDEWIAAGEQAPLYPVMAVQILCLLQKTKTQGATRCQCCHSAWPAHRACSGAGSARGSPAGLGEWAGSGHGCGCAMSPEGLSAGTFRLFEGSCQELSEQHGACVAWRRQCGEACKVSVGGNGVKQGGSLLPWLLLSLHALLCSLPQTGSAALDSSITGSSVFQE